MPTLPTALSTAAALSAAADSAAAVFATVSSAALPSVSLSRTTNPAESEFWRATFCKWGATWPWRSTRLYRSTRLFRSTCWLCPGPTSRVFSTPDRPTQPLLCPSDRASEQALYWALDEPTRRSACPRLAIHPQVAIKASGNSNTVNFETRRHRHRRVCIELCCTLLRAVYCLCVSN